MAAVMGLQIACRDRVGDGTFNGLLDNLCFLFAPCSEEDFSRCHDVGHAERDGAGRHGILTTEAHRHLFAGGGVDEDKTGTGCKSRARFVGGNVSGTADAKE